MGHPTKATIRAVAMFRADRSGRAKTRLVEAIAKRCGIHVATLWRALRKVAS